MKFVYLYDGTLFVCKYNDEREYIYPDDQWTETPPPEGIYSPFYFNGTDWIGLTRDEWLSQLPEKEPVQPSASELMMASTQMQVAESSFQLRDTQTQLAQSILEGVEKDKRIEKLEQQQAEVLLELAEMKGVN